MRIGVIWAVVLRYVRVVKTDVGRIAMIFSWPLLDVIIWGFLGKWMQSTQTTGGYELLFLMIILLWQLVGRTGSEVGFTLLEDLWSRNILNMFASPLQVREWLMGIVIFVGMIISSIIIYCIMLSWLFFHGVSILKMLKLFVLFGPSLFLSGIWIGLIGLICVILLGKSAGEFTFIAAWGFSPFVGAFYPIDILPSSLHYISYALPMTYVFQSVRNMILHNQFSYHLLGISYLLNILYLSCLLSLFYYGFSRSKEKGLVRLWA